MTDALTEFAKASSGLWGSLVVLSQSSRVEVLADALAAKTGTSKGVITVKLKAIRHARESGLDWQEIIDDGQSVTLKRFAKANRKNAEKRKRICFLVSVSLADAFQCENQSPDAEESLVTRLARCCHLKTSDDLLEYLLAHFGAFSDLELTHDAGEISAEQIPRKKKKHASS